MAHNDQVLDKATNSRMDLERARTRLAISEVQKSDSANKAAIKKAALETLVATNVGRTVANSQVLPEDREKLRTAMAAYTKAVRSQRDAEAKVKADAAEVDELTKEVGEDLETLVSTEQPPS